MTRRHFDERNIALAQVSGNCYSQCLWSKLWNSLPLTFPAVPHCFSFYLFL